MRSFKSDNDYKDCNSKHHNQCPKCHKEYDKQYDEGYDKECHNECHKEYDMEWDKCPHCHSDSHHDFKCPKCDKKCHKDWHWCPWCGQGFQHSCC